MPAIQNTELRKHIFNPLSPTKLRHFSGATTVKVPCVLEVNWIPLEWRCEIREQMGGKKFSLSNVPRKQTPGLFQSMHSTALTGPWWCVQKAGQPSPSSCVCVSKHLTQGQKKRTKKRWRSFVCVPRIVPWPCVWRDGAAVSWGAATVQKRSWQLPKGHKAAFIPQLLIDQASSAPQHYPATMLMSTASSLSSLSSLYRMAPKAPI